MSTPEKLERILAAMYAADHADPTQRQERQEDVHALATEILAEHPRLTRWDLMRIVRFRYCQYRTAMRKREGLTGTEG